MKRIKHAFASGIGASVGAGAYMLITDPFGSGKIDVPATLICMLVFGIVFALISAALHAFRTPSLLTCIQSGMACVLLIAGVLIVSLGPEHLAPITLATAYKPVVAMLAFGLLVGLGGWLGLRIASD